MNKNAKARAPRHYLCVFIRDAAVFHDVVDLTQDPDFSVPPTWGICRPHVRARWVDVGSKVVFLGRDPAATSYVVKGIITVGEKISYRDALSRFPTRENVIVRAGRPPTRPNVTWKRKKLTTSPTPDFLVRIGSGSNELHQNPTDQHEIDNWKCQRMFLCQERQLRSCLAAKVCQRDGVFDQLTGYIVAASWIDVGSRLLDWDAVRPKAWGQRKLRTPKGQHNALEISQSDIDELITKIAARIGNDGVSWQHGGGDGSVQSEVRHAGRLT